MENIENIKDLLEKVAVINKEYADKLDATGERFNEFEITIRKRESPNSEFIAALLNPEGSHGLKHEFLKCFINTLVKKIHASELCFDLKKFNCEKADVKTEPLIDNGRLDIFITDNKNRAIIIENKISSPDGERQIKRYDEYAEKVHKKGNYQILYLTPHGKEASKQSVGNVKYLCISYEDTIINWLKSCLDVAVRHDNVKNAINQYIKYLKKLTNQDMDTNKRREIIEIMSKPEYLRAVKDIYDINVAEVFNSLAEKHFNPKMQEFAKQKKMIFTALEFGHYYLKFGLTHPEWQNEYEIAFGDGSESGMDYGIQKKTKAGVRKSQKIENGLRSLGYKTNKNWLVYKNYGFCLDRWYTDIVDSNNFFNDCKIIIEELLQAIEGV